MSDRTKTPPETPAAKTTASDAHYHTFEFRDAGKKLEGVPPDWYDGKPKRCPGSGLPPGVQYHGEVSDDGEPKYLCRCPWCDRPFRPGPMPEHTFVPVRIEDFTFRTGQCIEGMDLEDIKIDPDPDVPGRVHVTIPPMLRPDDAGVVSFTINHEACPACGHQHGGAEVGFICIGCPCDARPEVDWNAQRTTGDPPLCDGCKQLRAQGIAEGKAGFVLCPVCLAARSRDGNHPEPPCLDEQCHLKGDPDYAYVLARRIGQGVQLLCNCCHLPLNAEPITTAGGDDEPATVWHLACAMKHAEPKQ